MDNNLPSVTFKVMTWNVENLFSPKEEALEELKRFHDKLALLARVINELEPDVVALQEVGGEQELLELQRTLGGNYPYCACSGFPDRRGIRVAFLSRLAITEQVDIVEFPPGPALDIYRLTSSGGSRPINRMGRGALQIRVNKEGRAFDLITAHLKSKLLSYPRARGRVSFTPRDDEERAQVAGITLMRRTAEAVTLRLYINALLESDQRNPLVLLGDFNDVPEAQTSLILNGPGGSEIDTRGFHLPDQGDDARLFNLAPRIPRDRRFSRIYRGRSELLDQILASEELFPVGEDGRRRLPLVDSHIDFEDQLVSITDNPGDRVRKIAPDHSPVTATFELE